MFENAGYMFQEIKDYLDAKEKSDECFEKGEIARIKAVEDEKDRLYKEACDTINSQNENSNLFSRISVLEDAIIKLEKLEGWQDSSMIISQQRQIVQELKLKYKETLDDIRRNDELEQERERIRKRDSWLVILGIALVVAVVIIANL